MSDTQTFTLDGVAIEFSDGDTIMDAALRAGAYIPHLCHNPEFTPHGSCRVCIVDVNGRKVSACTQPAAAGLDVDNHSEAIVAERRSLLGRRRSRFFPEAGAGLLAAGALFRATVGRQCSG